MREIKLTQGQTALVDDADYAWLNQYKWQAHWDPKRQCYYAVRGEYIGGGRKNSKIRTITMHRQILGLPAFPGDKRKGDHKEPSETLNNQRYNLRPANDSQSGANRRLRSDNITGFKGVSPRGSGYIARLRLNGKLKWLGTRPTPEAAFHELYVPAAQEAFGEFARIA